MVVQTAVWPEVGAERFDCDRFCDQAVRGVAAAVVEFIPLETGFAAGKSDTNVYINVPDFVYLLLNIYSDVFSIFFLHTNTYRRIPMEVTRDVQGTQDIPDGIS